MIHYIMGVILFMIATMILITWGIIKEKKDPYALQRKLWVKTKNKIINSLKRNGKMEFKSIQESMKYISVSNFGSKRKLAILEPEVFVKAVLDDLVKKGEIQVDYSKKLKRYYL